jgi:hypothetical protein
MVPLRIAVSRGIMNSTPSALSCAKNKISKNERRMVVVEEEEDEERRRIIIRIRMRRIDIRTINESNNSI